MVGSQQRSLRIHLDKQFGIPVGLRCDPEGDFRSLFRKRKVAENARPDVAEGFGEHCAVQR